MNYTKKPCKQGIFGYNGGFKKSDKQYEMGVVNL